MSDASVLAVPRQALFGGHWPDGFLHCTPADAATLTAAMERNGRFLPRPEAESDPGHKQPIPYCVIRRAEEVFVVERLPAQGEERLRGRISVGLGGHVEPEDGHGDGLIARGMQRELAEELALPADHPVPRLIGLVNSEADAVGQVHVGLVHLLDLDPETPSEAVKVREIRKMRGGFRGLAGWRDLWQDAPRLERWSRLVLDAIDGSIDSSGHGRPLLDRTWIKAAKPPLEESEHGGTEHSQSLS